MVTCPSRQLPATGITKISCVVLVAIVAACGCGGGSAMSSDATTPVQLHITLAKSSMPLGTSQPVAVAAVTSSGSTDVTQIASWSSSSPNTVGFSSAGVLHANAVGTTLITATYSGASASAQVTVGPAALLTLSVSPERITVPFGLPSQIHATGGFTDGSTSDVTPSVSWSVSNPIARVSTTGLVSPQSVGSATLTAIAGTLSASAAVSITPANVHGDSHSNVPEQYIWYDSTDPTVPRYFRAAFTLSSVPAQATLYLAGDSVTAYLNGTPVATAQAVDMDGARPLAVASTGVQSLLQLGLNELAVRGSGAGRMAAKIVPAAAGLPGSPIIVTSATWKSSTQLSVGWEQPTFDDSAWSSATSLGGVEDNPAFFEGHADLNMYDWPGYEGISPFLAVAPVLATNVLDVLQGAGSFSATEALTDASAPAEFTAILSSAPDGAAPSLILDFGRELNGRLEFTSDSAAPVSVEVSYGESLEEVINQSYITRTLNAYPGETVHGPKCGFRYAKLRFPGFNATVRLSGVHAQQIYLPVAYKGWFESSDAIVNRIFGTSVTTAHLVMQDHIWDGIKRDRLAWMGDTAVTDLTSDRIFAEATLPARTMDAIYSSLPQIASGHINGIPGYTALWIKGQADHYRNYGDREYLQSIHTSLVSLMQRMTSDLDSSHLFAFGTDVFPFVDWSPDFAQRTWDATAATHFQYIVALRDGVWLLQELGDDSHATYFASVLDEMTTAANTLLWNSATQTYGTRLQTNAMAIVSDVASGTQGDSIFRNVLSQPSSAIVSPYFQYFVLTAMAKSGHRQEAIDWMRKYWGGMLDEGATSFWEAYDLSWPKTDYHAYLQADFTQGYRISLCHGWSSGPAAWLMEQILGVQPTGPGYSSVEIRPDLSGLDWVSGVQPTPYGDISVVFQSSAGYSGDITLPAGVHAVISVPGNGSSTVAVNSVVITYDVVEAGQRTAFSLNGPGTFHITVR